MTARVVIASAALPYDAATALGSGFDYREPESGWLDRQALAERVAEADSIISVLRTTIDGALMDAAPRLRLVANCAVGYDNVDVAAATDRGIAVTNTPDVLTDATADFAFALLLAAARRVVEGDRLVRGGGWQGWEIDQLLGAPVAGATLGIVGMGRIGQAVARRARGFSMNVVYFSPRPVAAAADGPLGAVERVELEELLARSDFVTLHCPLRDDTHHLIDAGALAAMKPGAILVNTARGPCVDERALADALAAGRLGGAGLDVFEREPEIEQRLRDCARAVLAPHAGSATTTTRARMVEICIEAVRDLAAGRRPRTLLNPAALDGTARRPGAKAKESAR